MQDRTAGSPAVAPGVWPGAVDAGGNARTSRNLKHSRNEFYTRSFFVCRRA
nr:MAG TPA: hypothetical protein [Caudoviricetes sp.]DAZ60349.1 MAG TPA: hypothetical protein [Caudoviricetes sp.]